MAISDVSARWRQKPPVGAILDRSNPLTRGLVAFYAINEGTGPAIADLTLPGGAAALAGAAAWAAGPAGADLLCNVAGAGAVATLAAAQVAALALPITVAVSARSYGTPAGSPFIAALSSAPTGGGTGLGIYLGGATYFPFAWNGSAGVYLGTPLPPLPTVLAAGFGAALTTVYFAGRPGGSGGAATLPGWTPAACASIGTAGAAATGATPAVAVDWLGVWNRLLAPEEHAAIGADPAGIWQIFRPRYEAARLYVPPGGRPAYRGGSSALRSHRPLDARHVVSYLD